jgi:hypothetical protein
MTDAELQAIRERSASSREVELQSILEAVGAALDGIEVSDFMLSFPVVRGVADLLSEVSRLRREHERSKAKLEAANDPTWPLPEGASND